MAMSPGRSQRPPRRVSTRDLALVGAIIAVALLLPSCGNSCVPVDYTIPPADQVFGGATALVRARVVGFRNVEQYTLEAESSVTEVLTQDADRTPDVLAPGSLTVGAYDDSCGRRTGLRFADDNVVLVVLRWVGANETWDSPWRAYPVLAEDSNGQVAFLDTGDNLNGRIAQILPEPTGARLIAAVSKPD